MAGCNIHIAVFKNIGLEGALRNSNGSLEGSEIEYKPTEERCTIVEIKPTTMELMGGRNIVAIKLREGRGRYCNG